MYKTLTGILCEVSDGSYYMECDNGFFPLFSTKQDIPTNKLIALSVLREPDESCLWHVTEKVPCYTRVQGAEALTEPRKHVMLVRFVGVTSSDEHVENSQIIVDHAAKWLENYYNYYTGDNWDIKFRGYVIKYGGDNTPPYYARDQFDNYIANNDMKGFEPNYFHGWGARCTPNVCGLANRGGNRAASKVGGGCTSYYTLAHEQGHNFNLSHAGSKSADGTISEYGNKYSIMGANTKRTIQGHTSHHLIQLGAYKEREVKVIDTTQSVLIAPIEMPYHGMHPEEYQHIVVKQPGKPTHYLTLRKSKGTQYPVPGAANLYIDELEARKSHTKVLPVLRPGNSRKIYGGVTIDYKAYANETAAVGVIFPPDTTAPNIDMPIGIPSPIPSAHVNLEHSGCWYDARYDGQGLDVYTRWSDGQLEVSLYWYTYDNDGSGRAIYYMGHGFVVDGVCNFEIKATAEGTWSAPENYVEYVVGEGQLYFLSEDLGVFNFDTDDYGRGGFEITPVILTNNAMDGSYYDPTKPGTGLGMRFFTRDDLDQCTGFWYAFDNGGHQIWFTCNGFFDPSIDGYNISLCEYLGGAWMYYDKPESSLIGTAVLSMQSRTFEYDVDFRGIEDMGVLNLSRL